MDFHLVISIKAIPLISVQPLQPSNTLLMDSESAASTSPQPVLGVDDIRLLSADDYSKSYSSTLYITQVVQGSVLARHTSMRLFDALLPNFDALRRPLLGQKTTKRPPDPFSGTTRPTEMVHLSEFAEFYKESNQNILKTIYSNKSCSNDVRNKKKIVKKLLSL